MVVSSDSVIAFFDGDEVPCVSMSDNSNVKLTQSQEDAIVSFLSLVELFGK